MLKATPRLRFPPPPRKKSFLAAKPRHAVIGLSAETEGCARTPLGSPYIWAPRRASPLLFVFTFFSPQKAAFAGGSQPDFHPLRVDEIVPLLLFGGSWTSSPPLQMQSNMPVHHEKRPLDPFSERFDACLAAYDHVGGDPGEKKLFKGQVRHALFAEDYNGQPVEPDTVARNHEAWLPILRELDAMYAALCPSGPPPSSPYAPKEILRLWKPVLTHAIVALRGKLDHITISTGGSVYDRYDHNPFINRVKDILDLYKFYLDDQYKIYFRAGCQVLEKRFLERLDTALTSDEVPGPSVDLNVKRQGETWKAILEELDVVHSALQTAATNPSKADRNLEPQERLNKALFENLPELERLIREYRAQNLGTSNGAGHSEHNLASGSRVRGVRGVAPPPAEGATRGKRLCPLEFDPETSSTTISFSPKRVHQSLLSCRPFFCLPMSHRNDPFYAHLRAVLTVYADTEHPDVDVAANFRRDLVQAWTTHSLPEMLVPTETATKLHGEVIDALVELKDELETKAHANNNASESVAQCLEAKKPGLVHKIERYRVAKHAAEHLEPFNLGRSGEAKHSRYRVPLVNGIEAVLAVCGRAQGWDEDVSADFLDELMAAWERQHVPDQPVPRKDPQQLAEDILSELDNLKRELEKVHHQGSENIKQCLETKLDTARKDLIWKIEKLHAATLVRNRGHLSHTNSLNKLAKVRRCQGCERLANARTRGRYGRARSRAAELRRTRYEAVLSLLGRPGSELAPASKDLSVLPLNSNLIHFHPQNASEHELCQKINEYCEAVKPEEERRQIAAASLGE
ncbi:hypothetical protein C6P46_000994 [Rhodotorula mucilaginosa]|uniref:Uncharacterized protein n=1 Tax=Rhodotorula mucilaginosa TaxID=5537 RepID=A0A9P6VTM0_RHOMI|nr:hypothetical protein C6P46_000994 [Rhodotorula mucilaginosa]